MSISVWRYLMGLVACSALISIVQGQNAPAPPPASDGGMQPSAECAALSSLKIEAGSVTSAERTAAGDFHAPAAAAGPGPAPPARAFKVPEFCRVVLLLKPSADSEINTEVWLPVHDWNGKLEGLGNPGFAGSVLYTDLGASLRGGYVAVSSDGGHSGGSPRFAYQHPERLIDYGWRAAHEMTVAAKTLIMAYYGVKPRYTYFVGCSGGGRMALMEAQRFPQDYDGVLAGSAGDDYARLTAYDLWKSLTNLDHAGKPILNREQFALLHARAIKQCDALDGIKDGEISDPRRCGFRPQSLLCKAKQDSGSCLSAAQVAAANRLYAGMKNPKNGQLLYPGMIPGGELSYSSASAAPMSMIVDFHRYLVQDNPSWDYTQLNLNGDIAKAEQRVRPMLADDPSLRAFQARGGKLIEYAGWSESTPPPENAINYYESVVKTQRGLAATEQYYRLFLMPNAAHCGGGYDTPWFSALSDWVEHRRSPDSVVTQKLAASANEPLETAPAPVAQRLLCPYPQVSHYRGRGDATLASSFECVSAARGARAGEGPAHLGEPIATTWAKN